MFILYGSLISSNIKNSLEHCKSVHPYHAEFIQRYVNISHYYSSIAYAYERIRFDFCNLLHKMNILNGNFM